MWETRHVDMVYLKHAGTDIGTAVMAEEAVPLSLINARTG